jgi:hypothetical protein
MPQDEASGARADAFGRVNAVRIAGATTARLLAQGRGNEAVYRGRKTVLKSAGKQTSSVGVGYKMLKRLDSIIAAFELPNGRWRNMELDVATFKRNEPTTRSTGSSVNKVGIVAKNVFLNEGWLLGECTLR